MGELVSTERSGAVAVVRLDHPPVNAVTWALVDELDAALLAADADAEIGAVVLTGNGRGFCAGGDTRAMGANTDLVAKRALLGRSGAVIQRITGIGTPVVGAIHGFAVGAGISLAAACDVTVADVGTRMRMGFRDVAITPDMGAHHFLAQALGVRRAKELIWSGGEFTATEAMDWGLVNRVVPDGEALDAALDEAERLAAGPRAAIAYTKLVLAGADADRLRQVVDAEAWASALLRATGDHHEAVAAQREKRAPVFGPGRDAG
jgi:2-(1,2-epoxy-1,2-dihydrophenyl)acetyl-CoA isomerase